MFTRLTAAAVTVATVVAVAAASVAAAPGAGADPGQATVSQVRAALVSTGNFIYASMQDGTLRPKTRLMWGPVGTIAGSGGTHTAFRLMDGYWKDGKTRDQFCLEIEYANVRNLAAGVQYMSVAYDSKKDPWGPRISRTDCPD